MASTDPRIDWIEEIAWAWQAEAEWNREQELREDEERQLDPLDRARDMRRDGGLE